MLEKIKGHINVAKIRAILLLEADFNGMNKITHKPRMFLRLEACGVIPYEVIGGRRGKYFQHVALNKKLV